MTRRPPQLSPHCSCLAVILIVSGCDGEDDIRGTVDNSVADVPVAVVTHSSEAIRDAEPISLSSEPAARIGVTSGPVELAFTSISDARRLSDGSFVVVDQRIRTVRHFDDRGRFLREVGGRGDGPGEYRGPTRIFDGPDGHIAVLDDGRRILSSHRLDGVFVERLGLLGPNSVVAAASFLPSGDFLLIGEAIVPDPAPVPGVFRTSAALMSYAAGTGAPDTLISFVGAERPRRMVQATNGPTLVEMIGPPAWYHHRVLAAATAEGAWISSGKTWSVEHRSATDGAVDRIVHFDLPLEPIPDNIADTLPELDRRATVPPIREIFADALGQLWVGLTTLPVENLPTSMGSAVREWIVLAPTGDRVVGRLVLPPRSRPLFADGDGVLILTVGPLDAPHLEWRLFTPAPVF